MDVYGKIEASRKLGLSDKQIADILLAQPEAAKSREAGISDDQLLTHFGLAPKSQGVVEYIDKTLGNVPRDLMSLSQGAYNAVTDPLQTLQNVATAVENPIQTGAQIAGGIYNAMRHPLETFQEAPVSTALSVAGAAPLVKGAIGVAKLPNVLARTITQPEPGLAPALRAETATAQKGAYQAVKESPARYDSNSYTNFLADAKQGLSDLDYEPMAKGTYKNITKVLKTLDNYQDSALDMKAVKNIRKEIGTLYKTGTDAEKVLATDLTRRFDKFWENPSNAAPGFEADVMAAAPELRRGIDATRELFQDRVISLIVKRANAAPDFADSLKKQFSKIVENERKFDRFTPDQQTIIRDIAEGATSSPWIDQLAALAPGFRGKKITTGAEAYLALSHPYLAAGIAFAGKGAKMATERGARQAVNRLAEETFKSKNAMAR